MAAFSMEKVNMEKYFLTLALALTACTPETPEQEFTHNCYRTPARDDFTPIAHLTPDSVTIDGRTLPAITFWAGLEQIWSLGEKSWLTVHPDGGALYYDFFGYEDDEKRGPTFIMYCGGGRWF